MTPAYIPLYGIQKQGLTQLTTCHGEVFLQDCELLDLSNKYKHAWYAMVHMHDVGVKIVISEK